MEEMKNYHLEPTPVLLQCSVSQLYARVQTNVSLQFKKLPFIFMTAVQTMKRLGCKSK